MGKSKSVPVPEAEGNGGGGQGKQHRQPQQPLSGSKKTKQANHVDHHNPQG
ncbi:small acid-soluble spore protein P [Paenibacillus sp. NPDC058071]|uniref:small acid-soluble spore protein P n=1 Tax=Paenibacillus sp. NPDC058071 TaxID=3346326 RepID=UPI0036D7B237